MLTAAPVEEFCEVCKALRSRSMRCWLAGRMEHTTGQVRTKFTAKSNGEKKQKTLNISVCNICLAFHVEKQVRKKKGRTFLTEAMHSILECLSNTARPPEFEKHRIETTSVHVGVKNACRIRTSETHSRTTQICIENSPLFRLWHLPEFWRPTKRSRVDAKATCLFVPTECIPRLPLWCSRSRWSTTHRPWRGLPWKSKNL